MNLINLENVAKSYGPKPLLDAVSLGLDEGDRVGVVGRNGGGKSTLVSVVARETEPDAGRVTHARGLRLGLLSQRDEFPEGATVRSVVLGDRAEHEWAGDVRARDVLAGLVPDLDLDAPVAGMSGGERRRVALARLLVPDSDLLLLDEPTNHLDIEAIAWLARHLKARGVALLVVTHDRWFLDEVTERTWEVVDGRVERYEGGYSAYVLAKAERARIAAATEAKRQNLLRKELAWLRRGPQARTSKPKFRVDAAQALIADEPPPRDAVELTRFATARLGKTVYDVEDVTVAVGEDRPDGHGARRTLFDRMTWRIGPGDRVGLVGVNGSGKSTLLRLLDGSVPPVSGKVVRGKTVQLAHLSQNLEDLDPERRVLESVEEIRRRITVGKREWTASQLLERLGFQGDRQWTPIGDLSGGERRRLQILRLLMGEPNVLLMDEPTNDLDIETLTEVEDLLDGWPGTLIVVSHDRYFLERITDHVVALLGDGRVSMLPGGVDEYLERRAAGTAPKPARPGGADTPAAKVAPAPAKPKAGGQDWKARKELDRLERRLEKLARQETELHEQLAAHATDYTRLQELDGRLKEIQAEAAEVEEEWLMLAEDVG
ncbi:ABC-F family ATP-binding cassette domain-containing protein [Actinomadura livida]|uniref:ABC-F family ATP-binding cassette domain-containing protein n=1 Tax=Actinomadura livida TaxID=79909 RepID=A0A7W7MW21_9ACTN|nr:MULTISPECIES: ABC-F family ATP-binding cassette domain-containing protein [Actinomadura]MBB4773168.1 ATP-binding cassette subfamily F protein uup [Actinomadura catellatispora]GGU18490.1 ABC transporter ATP-binding protein [Actinomadura livida]